MKNNEINISPLRKHINQITYDRGNQIPKGKVVLEVGCGEIDLLKKIIQSKGSTWYGVDPKGSVASHKGSVGNIPFEDQLFDFVVCSQSIEHWPEFYTTFDKGLSEIHRVLKKKGIFYIDFPFFLHGHPYFMLGLEKTIENLFYTPSWEIVSRNTYVPNPPYYTWNGKRKKKYIETLCQKKIKKLELSSSIVSYVLQKKEVEYCASQKKIMAFINIALYRVLNIYDFFRFKIDR